MHRRDGLRAINQRKLAEAKKKARGGELAESNLSNLSQQLEKLRENLSQFAQKHRNEIKRDAEFRKKFQTMCANIGVDPLASSKGFWSELLGVGDYYYEIGVQIIEVCLANNYKTGGIMSLEELHRKLLASRYVGSQRSVSASDQVSKDDIRRAIEKLQVLGAGFKIIQMRGGKTFVQSIPGELSMDLNLLFEEAGKTGGWVTKSLLHTHLSWESERCDRNLQDVVANGLVWIDDQMKDEEERSFWFPSIFREKQGKGLEA